MAGGAAGGVAKADFGVGGPSASEKWAFGFLLDLRFLFHMQPYKVKQYQRVPGAKSLLLQFPSPVNRIVTSVSVQR